MRTEYLEKLKTQKAQLENKIRAAEKRLSEKERKERTRKLIQIGAIFEKALNIESVEQAQQIAEELVKSARQNTAEKIE